jgi:UDP:flavonoid glycosyltransferase YjiC (YdhE family)
MHVLVTLWDGGGTVPAELGVVRRLVARGHAVTVLADPPMAAAVAAAGAGFRSWREAPHRRTAADRDIVDDVSCRTPLGVLDRLLSRLIAGPAAAIARDVRSELARRPADVVVVSGALLGAVAAAESLGVPSVVLCANVYPRPTTGLPPFGSGLRPATGPLGRVRDRVLPRIVNRLWNRGLPPLNAARRSLGLEPLGDLWQQWDRASRVLVLTSPAFDLPARLPANVRYVGPVLEDPHWVAPVELPPGRDPLVVVGLSSTHMRSTAGVLRRIVAALAELPVRAIVSTGPAVDPADVPGATNVAVVRSAPHRELFPHASVVITHAGHGTLLKALAAGVPTLCLPMGRDQEDNVVRAARHGAVLRLRPTARPEQIAGAVRRLLDEPAFRLAAQRIGERLRADAASGSLVAEVESAAGRTNLTGHPPPTRREAR